MLSMEKFRFASILCLCLLIVTVITVCTAFAIPYTRTFADEIKISLDDTSDYASYGDAIVYTTKDNALVLSTEKGKFSLPSAYDGKCKSIAMNDKYIFMLSYTTGETKDTISFLSFEYSCENMTISQKKDALLLFGVSPENIANNTYFVNANEYGIGGFDKLYVDGNNVYCIASADKPYEATMPNDILFAADLSSGALPSLFSYKDFALADSFTVNANKIYFTSQGKIYSTSKETNTPSSAIVSSVSTNGIVFANGFIVANCADGVYAVNPETSKTKKLLEETFEGKISVVRGAETTYILLHDKDGRAVKQYILTGDFESSALTYFNSFDDMIYNNPQTYDILKAGKAVANTKAYYSPKNMKTEFEIAKDSYVLILAAQDGFYYTRNEQGQTGYVRQNELTVIEPSTSTDLGKYAQALHDNTNIYKYPYVSSDVVATVGISQMLIVVDNVAQDGDNQVWNWYKVCILAEDGTMTYGYIQKEYASKFDSFRLPSFSSDATVSAGSIGGRVNVYLLPDENSEVLGTLGDGEKVVLAQEKIVESEEWTKIVYGDIQGYIKTANLTTKGLTSLQITLIVVFSVVIVATVIIAVLVVKKRRAQRYDY